MAVSLSSLPTTSRLFHVDEIHNHSPTKPLFIVNVFDRAASEGLQLARSHRARALTASHRLRHALFGNSSSLRTLVVTSATEGSRKSEENVPSWAKPDSDEPPPWARDEGSGSTPQDGFQIPFFVYLLASAITAIAAIGSVFEYVNKKPVFGILSSDSVFYAPLLGFFAITGIPTSAFLWFKSVQAANKEAEEQDRRDGFL